MNNNDVLRLVRTTFNLKDKQIIAIFAQAETTVTPEQVQAWLADESAKGAKKLKDVELSTFLNGFINQKRGKRDGEQPKPEANLTNNMVFQKLRIALNLKTEDILNIFELVGVELTKYELGAFFRKPDNKHYRPCPDQILQDFLTGVEGQRLL
ncbi:DUF1456 family protein [Vibrio sp. CAIM 722]|uniref:DUF1456 family protein n=1 Tax=Vibrio eleionomae TaxID=2653505 RepID=A0A7X4RWR6_9VIBR|nr:DUF1456 family protein [Vibrio eleionomae]MZI95978.1 DUF1456 family protein [Vibrio eleionomae]